ncbi:MAG: hypothetical protein JXQ90_13605 [Cyclobacteriaceae bacterium]
MQSQESYRFFFLFHLSSFAEESAAIDEMVKRSVLMLEMYHSIQSGDYSLVLAGRVTAFAMTHDYQTQSKY